VKHEAKGAAKRAWRLRPIRSRPALVNAEGSWLAEVRARVDAHLSGFFAVMHAQAERTSPDARVLIEAIAELTMRGGKRLRPAALFAAYRGVTPDGDPARTNDASAAVELLQTYLLTQDDWMDGDLERRGGPSVHAALSERCGDARLGASLAILAADMASGFAWELIAAAPFPDPRVREALAVYGRMHFEVLCGQQLDLLGHADIALVNQLKTGSYTVRGPLKLGALLGDARPEQLSALERFGEPLGLAFQLRDDLLSTFGDAGAIGKPIGNDLKAGKRTALLADARARLGAGELAVLDAVVGNAHASAAQVARACDVLIASGVRERLETRVAQLLEQALGVLRAAPLAEAGKALLSELASRLAQRDR
jgi:geranylgeranyl diphosphate synthase type I